jgi:hypothetical protein
MSTSTGTVTALKLAWCHDCMVEGGRSWKDPLLSHGF